MNVAILGSSQKPERYSHMALTMLVETGHTVFPVHPTVLRKQNAVFEGEETRCR